MFNSILGFLPSFRRSNRSKHYSNDLTLEAALTQQKDDSCLSTSWSTISHCEGESTRVSQSSSKAQKPKRRMINVAISQIQSKSRDEYLACEDISKGREYYKIPAVSFKRNDVPPTDYHYVTDHVQYDLVPLDNSLRKTTSCNCTTDCSEGNCYCSSLQESGRYYDSKGRLSREYNLESPSVIYECNAGCNCNRKLCKNIVIQNGSKVKVTLFRTKSRGWGVRTLENLRQGTFVGVYSGELLSASASTEREDDTYLFNLASSQLNLIQIQRPIATDEAESDNQDTEQDENSIKQYEYEAQSFISESALVCEEKQQVNQPIEARHEQYVCDAKFYGNFTRFINHSCGPNVVGIRSFTSHHDNCFPHIAFFTNQDIPAHTELTLNYGDNYWLVKGKRDGIYCLCKRSTCRFNKKVFSTTLKLYKQQTKVQK